MITVHGGPELVAGLSAVADGLDGLDDAARGTVEILQADARGRAPKRTGKLAQSITGAVHSGVATVGTPVRYGLPVHFGVPAHNQRPQPFLAAAVTAQRSELTTVWAKDVQALIDRSV